MKPLNFFDMMFDFQKAEYRLIENKIYIDGKHCIKYMQTLYNGKECGYSYLFIMNTTNVLPCRYFRVPIGLKVDNKQYKKLVHELLTYRLYFEVENEDIQVPKKI